MNYFNLILINFFVGSTNEFFHSCCNLFLTGIADYFLTARSWAERGSCFTWVFFCRFVGDQTQTSLGHTSNDATYGHGPSAVHVLPGFFFNRAAMGRARFMFYPGFFFNRAAMGRARFMFYPGFFLTARPWAERGSCSTRVFLFFVVLSVTRPKLLSATLRMMQLMVFIRVKNILQIYEYYTLFSIKKLSLQQGGRMG